MNVPIVLDVETGGLDHNKNPITEFAGSALDPRTLQSVDRFHTFVKPYNNLVITQAALQRSQVTLHDIEAGVNSLILVKRLIEFFGKHTKKGGKITKLPQIVGHNVPFDIGFLVYLFELHNKNLWDYVDRGFWCTQRMMKNAEYKGDTKVKAKYDLTNCCSRRGITLRSAHGAFADVEATTELYSSLVFDMRSAGDAGADRTTTNTKAVKKTKARKTFQF